MKKKVLSAVLAAAMVFSMAACGNEPANSNNNSDPTKAPANNTQAPAANTAAPTAAPTADPRSEGEKLADQYTGYIETPMDLGGRTIRIACSLGSRYNYVKDKEGKDDVSATSAGTIEIIGILDQIAKDYNCKFEIFPGVKTGIVKDLQDGKAQGEPIYDIYDAGVSDTYLDTIWEQGLIMDLNDPKVKDIIKLDKNPWKGGTAAYGKFNGVQYGVEFVTKNSTNDLRNALLYNKELAEQYELGDLYQLVRDNKWTWEKFEELCEKIKQKDATMVPAGYGKENLIMPMIVASNGASMAVVGADGKKQYVGNTDEKVVAAYDWVYKLRDKGYMAANWTVKVPTGEKDDKGNDKTKNVLVEGGIDYDGFSKGKCVFYFDFYGDLQKLTQNTAGSDGVQTVTDYHFGLLPCPLGPNGDKCHGVTYSVDLKMIVDGVDKPEEVAAVLVAIANRTSKTPENIYEIEAASTVNSQDDLDMLKLMYEDMRYDVSRTVRKIKTADPGNNVLQLKKTAAVALEEIAENTQAVYNGEIKNW